MSGGIVYTEIEPILSFSELKRSNLLAPTDNCLTLHLPIH